MATPAEAGTTPTESRAMLALVASAAQQELLKAWDLVTGRSAETVRDFLMEVVPAIGDKYGMASAALAADWYDEIRASAAPRGSFLAEPAPLPDSSRYESLVRWGVDPLFRPEPDEGVSQSQIGGGLQKIVTNMHGQTLTESTHRDPAAQGWSRYARAEGCNVCKVLAGRGAVYRDSTADFATHDHCLCVAVPEFGAVRNVRDYERSKKFALDKAGEAKRRAANKALRDFAAGH